MSGPSDSEFDRRVVFKIPEYMPEIRDELMKYPPNQRSKRVLQLANLGLMTILAKQAEDALPRQRVERPPRGGGNQSKVTQQGQQHVAQPAQPNNQALQVQQQEQQLQASSDAPESGATESVAPLAELQREEPRQPAAVTAEDINEEDRSPATQGVSTSSSGSKRRNGPKWPTTMHP